MWFGIGVHGLVVKMGLGTFRFCGSALVGFYGRLWDPGSARKVFDEMLERDEVCYGAIIVGLARRGTSSIDAIRIFRTMRGDGVGLSLHSVSGVLRAVAEMAALEQCRVVHGVGVVLGFDGNAVLGSGLVDAYGKCGMMVDARRVFDELVPLMNVVGWNALMACYAQQGESDSVLELFESMIGQGLVPDEYSLLAVLTSLCNAGLADKTERWLTRMKEEYGLEPLLEHYTCLICVLARVGKFHEAEQIAMDMPFEPDAGVWRALLSGGAHHGAADFVWRMSQQLLELNPNDDSAYVIAANAFVTSARLDEALEVRKMMKNKKIRKDSGRSWIEVRGEVHVFLAEDQKHERREEIYAKLEELMEKIGSLGYVPVWDNIFDAEKKDRLWYHSEKLALAFGVLSGAAPPGKPLRIVKNLRICKDCHESFKYFSKLLEKEIIVRDVNRYHRFLEGSCNCKDHW